MPASRATSIQLDGDLDPARFAYLTPTADDRPASLGRLVQLARMLGDQAGGWEHLVRFDPIRRWRHRLQLDEPDGYQAWLLSWLPGQGTELHDHGGAPAVFSVLAGQLAESSVSPFDGRPRSQLVEAGQLRYWAPRHLRQLSNAGSAPAVSLHVYQVDGSEFGINQVGEMSRFQ
ncbi:MAG: cysteine dioxygenase family protein [Sporichthyaceae bacterium]|nr:cysteine dioxygenase family protein [Sporichthyaceae bacterium]